MTHGVTLTAPETLLTTRALDFLAAGPANSQTLISHVCQLPGAPAAVAEHLALTLFAGQRRFVREGDGRWRLALPHETAPPALAAADAEQLDALTYAVVDVETTGGGARRGDRITEVAVVQVRNGVATTAVDTLVNPQRSIPPWVSRLTNISWDMVKHAPTFPEICDQVLGALDGRVFVAHNAGFDWKFVCMEVERATGRTLHGRRLCTVRLARKLLPQLRRRSLDHLALHYGIEITGRHRAGGDAVATAQAFLRLLGEARDRGCTGWPDLERL
ncbi:MAG TPA: 3'-5' exonuclease, partial [Gemmatimonadaceae bacterium]|nr:3'-5' exonuclease [Gemmatimonadaceae bacterium]